MRSFRVISHRACRPAAPLYIEIERHLLVHAKKLHSRSLADFATDRRSVALLLAEITEASGPTAANMVRSSLSAFSAWLMREGLLESNPVTATNKAVENGARDRVLDDRELKLIWTALEDDRYGAIVKLLALTGLRRAEIGGLRVDEVDFDGEMIRLPPTRCKNAGRMMFRCSRPRSLF